MSKLTREFSKLLGVHCTFFFTKLKVTKNRFELRLIDKGGEPAGHILVRLAVGLVTVVLIHVEEVAGNSNVSKCDLLTNQEGPWQQVVIESSNDLLQVFLGLLSCL